MVHDLHVFCPGFHPRIPQSWSNSSAQVVFWEPRVSKPRQAWHLLDNLCLKAQTTTRRSAQTMKNTPQKHSAKKQNKHVLEDFAGKRRILRGPSAHVTAQGPTKHGCADSPPHLPNRGWFNDWWCSPSIQHFWGSLDFSDILEDKNNYLVVYHQEFLWIFPLNQGVTKPGCHLESSFPGGMELLEGGPK